MTRDDGLISQILLFFVFAIAAAFMAKLVAFCTGLCIRKQARRKKKNAKETETAPKPGISIPLPKGADLNTGLFEIMTPSENSSKASEKSHSSSKQKLKNTKNNSDSRSENTAHCSKTETNLLPLPGV